MRLNQRVGGSAHQPKGLGSQRQIPMVAYGAHCGHCVCVWQPFLVNLFSFLFFKGVFWGARPVEFFCSPIFVSVRLVHKYVCTRGAPTCIHHSNATCTAPQPPPPINHIPINKHIYNNASRGRRRNGCDVQFFFLAVLSEFPPVHTKFKYVLNTKFAMCV